MKSILLSILFVASIATANAAITIDPVSRTFEKAGGGASVLTQGSGSWTATTTTSWITISRASGSTGVSCVYIVDANMSVDTRTGTISISGNTHTVTQYGYEATLSSTSASFTKSGGSGTVSVTVDPGISWTARSNASWITISSGASGQSSGTVTYSVSSYSGLNDRTGTMTIAGNTFTVTQTGVDMTITPSSANLGYEAGVVSIEVSALAATTWSVSCSASWVSIVDPGPGSGNGTVMIAAGQNPSVKSRTANVSIGTKAFKLTQDGFPYPSLSIDPEETTADATGAYGTISVSATPDASWSATSQDSWITITSGSTGSGNGSVNYVVSANPGLESRTGRIDVSLPKKSFWDYNGAKTNIVEETDYRVYYWAQARVQAWINNSWEYRTVLRSYARNSTSQYSDVIMTNEFIEITSSIPSRQNGHIALLDQRNNVSGANVCDNIKVENSTVPPFSMTFWINCIQLDDSNGVCLVALNYNSSTGLTIYKDKISFFGTEVAYTVPIGEWMMVSIVRKQDNRVELFVNERKLHTKTCSIGYDSYYNELNWFGARAYGNSRIGIDEITLYFAALSETQIQGLLELGREAHYHRVFQNAASGSISPTSFSVTASGGSVETSLSISDNVSWTAQSNASWLRLLSASSGAGPTTVQFSVDPNPNAEARTGTATIAGKTLTVRQAGLSTVVTYDGTVFGPDGGSGFIRVATDGAVNWTAVSKSSWIAIAYGDSGTTSGETMFVVDPYTDPTSTRTGTIQIAGHDVSVLQRGYELAISPNGVEMDGNAGAGEIGVTASANAVWNALVSDDWITLVGGSSGTGSGTLHYSVSANRTGLPRTGRIEISGEVFQVVQQALPAGPVTFHVDASAGNDANDGLSWSAPKKTIQAALDLVEDGDSILVKPGVYKETADSTVAISNNRGKVVTITSTDGPDATVIDGDRKRRVAKLTSTSQQDSWQSHCATLVGFTLRNGFYGNAAVFCGRLENCILRNNVSASGTAVSKSAELVNCLVVDNVASNVVDSAVGGLFHATSLMNCTVAGNEVLAGNGSCGIMNGTISNSVFWGNSLGGGSLASENTACGSSAFEEPIAGAGNLVLGRTPFVDAGSGNYQLRFGSPCVNAGDTEQVALETDLAGENRVKGGAVDMGCYESDFVSTETSTSSEPVPYSWLLGFYPALSSESACETIAKITAKNGINKVWECYVAGLDPTNATSRFEARIEFENGKPVIQWSPDLGAARDYIVEGKETLGDGWGPTNAASRFFRVKVKLPE